MRIYEEQARQSKYLATICTDVPIEIEWENLKINELMNPEVYELFKQLEFKSFMDKFKSTVSNTVSNNHTKRNHKKVDKIDELNKIIDEIVLADQFSFLIFEENNKILGISCCYEDSKSIWIEASKELSIEEITNKTKNLLKQKILKRLLIMLKMQCTF